MKINQTDKQRIIQTITEITILKDKKNNKDYCNPHSSLLKRIDWIFHLAPVLDRAETIIQATYHLEGAERRFMQQKMN